MGGPQRSPWESHLLHLADRLKLSEAQRQVLIDELRDHVEARCADLMAAGWSASEAAIQALAELGDPAALAGQLAGWRPVECSERGRRRRCISRQWLWALGGAAASLAVALWSAWGPWVGRPAGHKASTPLKMDWPAQPGGASLQEQAMIGNPTWAGMVGGFVGMMAVAGLADAQAVPTSINHQGVVSVNGVRYTGTGAFKFALVDPQDGDENRWSNDGSQIGAAAEPALAVNLSVVDGIYSARLGDAGQGMVALSSSLFADADLRLRIWFDGGSGMQQLSPDHPLTSVPYAFRSVQAATVDDNAVTPNKLATDGASLAKVSNTLVQISGSRVGIGTAAPSSRLNIRGGAVWIGPVALSGDGEGDFNVSGAFSSVGWARRNMASYTGQAGDIFQWYSGDGSATALWTPQHGNLLTVTNNGRLGVGGIHPTYPLHVTGGAYCTGTAWVNASSREIKQGIHDLAADKALRALNELKPVEYAYRQAPDDPQVGFIAEDVPELVATPDRRSLGTMDVVAVLTKVVQEQQAQMDRQNQRIAALEAQLAGR